MRPDVKAEVGSVLLAGYQDPKAHRMPSVSLGFWGQGYLLLGFPGQLYLMESREFRPGIYA